MGSRAKSKDQTNDVSVAEEVSLELGYRVFSAMCAENSGSRFIQGVSAAFFENDDEFKDSVGLLMRCDTAPDFLLLQGVRMMIDGMDWDAAERFLVAWEQRESTVPAQPSTMNACLG